VAELRDGVWGSLGLQVDSPSCRGPKPPATHPVSVVLLFWARLFETGGSSRLIDPTFDVPSPDCCMTARPVAGKSTVTGVRRRAGFPYLITGAIVIRAVTLVGAAPWVDPAEPEAPSPCSWAISTLRLGGGLGLRARVWIKGHEVTAGDSSPRPDRAVSAVAALAAVREALTASRAMGDGEGSWRRRDIAGSVFPDAEFGGCLTASGRSVPGGAALDLEQRGDFPGFALELEGQIAERDVLILRAVCPLAQADDAMSDSAYGLEIGR